MRAIKWGSSLGILYDAYSFVNGFMLNEKLNVVA